MPLCTENLGGGELAGGRGRSGGEGEHEMILAYLLKVKHSSEHCRLSLSQSSDLGTGRPKPSALDEIWLKSVNRQTNR